MFSACGISASVLVTEVINSSKTWVAPSTTTMILVASGYGGAGGSSADTVSRHSDADTILFYHAGTGGAASGAQTWASAAMAPSIASSINSGGSGSQYATSYVGYGGDNTYSMTPGNLVSWSNAVFGSASVAYINWGSGTIYSASVDYYGTNGISWLEYTGTYSPTTGVSTAAFGKTFPGGTGGPATTTTFNSIAITPGASYPITIASGGSLTITYNK